MIIEGVKICSDEVCRIFVEDSNGQFLSSPISKYTQISPFQLLPKQMVYVFTEPVIIENGKIAIVQTHRARFNSGYRVTGSFISSGGNLRLMVENCRSVGALPLFSGMAIADLLMINVG